MGKKSMPSPMKPFGKSAIVTGLKFLKRWQGGQRGRQRHPAARRRGGVGGAPQRVEAGENGERRRQRHKTVIAAVRGTEPPRLQRRRQRSYKEGVQPPPAPFVDPWSARSARHRNLRRN